ncbi:MAG: hypothetical protein DI552_00230 [Brevundimonas sp.]|uniref:hypothetical protein n=1 Tax=Brevundimonas sp. TaxID=1871086 RepID=UPI000DBC0235|nr:hypothetical protein [Brevundimonas sp.]PZU62331.1 MAG: hypothetical protein DI552_00230 [Brevundimonas sp.]
MGDRVIGARHATRPLSVTVAHPAETAGERFVRDYVQAGRARNVSWQNLARQLGRAESDLRAAYQGIFG